MDVYKIRRMNIGKQGKGIEDWSLELSNTAVLKDPDGNEIERFEPEEAFDKFEFIRFANSGQHNFAIKPRHGESLYFAIWPKPFKKIQAFANGASGASSDSHLRALKLRGSVGVVAALFGIIYGLIVGLNTQNMKAIFIAAALIIGGVTAAIYYFRMAKSLKKS